MRFDYGTQLNPNPILLSIGTLKKPTLNEISRLTFDKFSIYEAFLKMTPSGFITTFKEDGQKYWDSLTEERRDSMTMYDLILEDTALQNMYVEIFDFFFIEPVIFKDGLFIILNKTIENDTDISAEDIRGAIHDKTFLQVLDVLQQICCIYEGEDKIDEMKFKNKTAKKLYEKMLKARKNERKKADINMSLPNIISAVSNAHPSINPINVWDLTIFQLLDSFNRLQANAIYRIDCTRVSVWGDEKNTFDIALWYKNNFDTK